MAVVISISTGQVTNGRLTLYAHVVLVVVHIKGGLGSVLYAPYHYCGYLDRVASLIVHLKPLAVKIAGAQGYFESPGLYVPCGRTSGFPRSRTALALRCVAHIPALRGTIRIERVSPMETRVVHSA